MTEGVPEYVVTLFPEGFKGVFVDVGAYDPLWISNSWIFEQAGWDVYCIEANPDRISKLQSMRKNVIELACGAENQDDVDFFIYCFGGAGPKDEPGHPICTLPGYEGQWSGEAAATGLIRHQGGDIALSRIVKVQVRTLDWVMTQVGQDHIDCLSIDVERNEMAVLRGCDLAKWKPKVIIIENIDQEQEQNDWLRQCNYRLVHRISVNDIWMLEAYYREYLDATR